MTKEMEWDDSVRDHGHSQQHPRAAIAIHKTPKEAYVEFYNKIIDHLD